MFATGIINKEGYRGGINSNPVMISHIIIDNKKIMTVEEVYNLLKSDNHPVIYIDSDVVPLDESERSMLYGMKTIDLRIPYVRSTKSRSKPVDNLFTLPETTEKIFNFEKKLEDLDVYSIYDVYVSPDFQSDETGGFPTVLCINFVKCKAWLELNPNVDASGFDKLNYREMCVDFGVRTCSDEEDIKTLFNELGKDAYDNVYDSCIEAFEEFYE